MFNLQREFNPKKRLYASQEYQAHYTKTTEKAISKLEISANFDSLSRKTKKEIIRKVLAEAVTDYDFSGDVVKQRKELLGIEQQVPSKGIIGSNGKHTLRAAADARTQNPFCP